MTLRVRPPEPHVARLAEEVVVDAQRVSLRDLRAAAAGLDDRWPRAAAMAGLLASDFPAKHRDFEAVLENEAEPPEFRHLAALYLGRIGTPVARDILVSHGRIRDDWVLSGVMEALGRIGDKASLGLVLRISQGTGAAAERAAFAATLIAHRLGLAPDASPAPVHAEFVKLPRATARPLEIHRAGAEDAEFCLRCLGDQPFGIELAEAPVYELRCGGASWLILFNREAIRPGALERLRKQRAFPAVVAARASASRRYFAALLLLTTPARTGDRVDALLYRSNGHPVLGGELHVSGDRAELSIRALSRPGAFAVQVEGAFEKGGRLEAKAWATPFAQVRKHPVVSEDRAEYARRR